MKAKTINAIITKKVNDWLQTIEFESLRKLAHNNTIVTGGCIASMLLNEPVNDFDIYFKTQHAATEIAQYYVNKFKPQLRKGIACNISVVTEPDRVKIVIKSAGIASENGTDKPYEYFEARPEGDAGEYIGEVMDDPGTIEDVYEETKQLVSEADETGKPKYRPVFLSTNAITLSNKIQLVLRFFGDPEEIHKNYDYVHCTNYWTSWNKVLVLRQQALESLLAKELVYVGSKYPVCSIFRLRKFIRRGWTINAGQILKAIMQINELDLTDINVLQDQLTGVDCAYFMEVIAKLKEKDPTKVNYAYLIEIIDRMFN
jgi:hypothetical protein